MSDKEEAGLKTNSETELEANSEVGLASVGSFDNAFTFVNQHQPSDEIDKARLVRKLDFIILPLLCSIYLLQYLDKLLLNYAAAMGIKRNLVGNEYANLSTIFYAAYIFGEPIVSYCLQKFPLGKTLGIFIIIWGVVVTCHSAASTYASLMVVRTLLGIFESSSAVGLIIISGMFYTKRQQVARMGIWSTMAGVGTIIGGLLSFAFQHVKTTKFQSWQILFLVMGVITILMGIIVTIFLPDNVHTCKFLTDQEKVYILNNVVKVNQTGTKNSKFKKEQIYELLFKDKFTWLYFLLTLCSQIVTGAIGTFSVTITLTFGFDSYESALLQLPVGAITIIIIATATQLASKVGHHTLVTASMFVPTIVGAIVLLISPNRVGNLLSLYLLYSGSCSITLIYAWIGANTAGSSKKFVRSAMIMIAFSVACIIGPQLFQAYSAPHYRPAKIVILITQCLSIPITLLIGWMCKEENEKRKESVTGREFLDLTDIENENFRYIY
ncbi:hypothetical protein KGF56_001135 [Candida oxycetoniae]|uniref:Major facilitator superfamily (MFS) profile domain-containing protein n=1 Tax=Candida oxycetoniae TaxID=497107 RepID=A0AAI9SZ89_9ASCO|nr:uncharacterized protein KGF56_001135 [Candida oxycetoniae]KAI3405916.2 hypothetical protein KGF56_001135 [Candida oxycetoniae]